LYAVAKSFRIPHPTKDGKMLVYGSLEGPENGVYIRGKLTEGNTIYLPEYWSKLVDVSTTTVSLTSVGKDRRLFVKSVDGEKVVIGSGNLFATSVECYYTIFAERKDIAKLAVEE
jgi:hypothetical protein